MNLKIIIMLLVLVMSVGCSSSYTITDDAQRIINNFPNIKNAKQVQIMKGTQYATPAFIFDSGISGKNVMILGGTHGNEPAGYEAALRLLEQLENKLPKSGKVILIPLANKQSIINKSRRIPVPDGADYERGNLNRCYPGKESGLPMEQMAYEIEQLTREHKVNVFIDIHEARFFHLDTPKKSKRKKGLGQTIIYYPNEKASWIVMNLIDTINETIDVSEEQFSAIERPILNSAAWWAGKYLEIPGFTFETTQKMDLEKRINFHLLLVKTVLELSEIW
ncbi:MAG: succinylglutamate desuccinylase/aspartoacylase family protein [Melioribacteraceae bacterium]|nr:succinylglutamate desuccinylase/aspartoacylase family protein [Melioribacteraceae bacterium]